MIFKKVPRRINVVAKLVKPPLGTTYNAYQSPWEAAGHAP